MAKAESFFFIFQIPGVSQIILEFLWNSKVNSGQATEIQSSTCVLVTFKTPKKHHIYVNFTLCIQGYFLRHICCNGCKVIFVSVLRTLKRFSKTVGTASFL